MAELPTVSLETMLAWRDRALAAERTLEEVRRYCSRATFGGCRHDIADIVDRRA